LKEKIHPKWFEATVVCSCGNTFTTGSTREKLHVEICSACHPFFTGNQKFVDTEGRVEKFMTKYGTVTSKKSKKDIAQAEKAKADAEAKAAAKAAEEIAQAAARESAAKAAAAAAAAPTETAAPEAPPKAAKPKRATKPRARKPKAKAAETAKETEASDAATEGKKAR
jgi:large subunit ribosomal protein L31